MRRLLCLLLALVSCPAGRTELQNLGFPGSCDFEDDECGWIDISTDEFRWRLEQANVSSIPGVDHTTGSPWGRVMHVNGERPGIFSNAALQFTSHQHSALGCQISFWYHLHDPIGISSHFALSLKMNDSSVNLWEIKLGQTDGWVNASVRVGNRPEGFKLVFAVDPTFIGSQDIMLDDVRLDGCVEGETPRDSDQLSCDFEKDLCAWYIDHSSSLTWQRNKPFYGSTGPEHDHTTGSGYYMYIATNWNSNPSQTARLISFPQQGVCVTFWYHIYGGSIGSLRFISKSSNGTETVVWMRTGTQGNKWRFVDLSFSNIGGPVQFIFEATLGGTDGSIAIDDVQVLSSVDGSCPAERECTFQSSLCGLLPDTTADFSWIRINGIEGQGSTGPSMDHTLGTNQGYYLSAQMSNQTLGSRGLVASRRLEPTHESGECWMFYYHMSGEDPGTLNVYLQDSPESNVSLWSRIGDQGEWWKPGRATAISTDRPYQIIFEAMAGSGAKKSIAIDDLTVLNGPCSPHGLCDFEMDQCDWLSITLSPSSVAWGWTSGKSANMFAPQVDHTTNSDLGHYMAFKTKSSSEQIAHLQSGLMQPTAQACLEFWYYMDMWLDKLAFKVYLNESGTLHPLWNQNGTQRRVWIKVTLDYKTFKPYQIVFEANRPLNQEGAIALDDVFIREDVRCSDIDATTPAPTTPPTTAPPSSMDCDFEDGLCGWVHQPGFNWIRQRGLQVNTSDKRPLYDHTIGNTYGFYLFLNMSGENGEETAVISTPVTLQAGSTCVEFWCFISGPSVAQLDLLIEAESEMIVWTRKGTEAAEWLKTQITVNLSDKQRVKISGSRSAKSNGFVALDDIRVTAGACTDHNYCGFEDASLCGFEHEVTDLTHWHHVNGSTGHIDHTHKTPMGHSMAVLGMTLPEPEATHLLTPPYSKTTEMCLKFWYWISAASTDSLSVHVYLNGDLGPVLWSLTGAQSTGWEVAEVTLSSPATFRIAFRAKLNPGDGSFVLLDDVSVRDGACTPRGSCDFESGFCTWMNVDSDNHDWVDTDGRFHDRLVDHTTHTADGRFIVAQSEPGYKAVLMSERILQIDSCVSFWYHINGSDSGTLRVFVDTDSEKPKIIFETRDVGLNWSNFTTTVSEARPYQIILEAESGNHGFIAVDDVTVTKGQCQELTSVNTAFAGCDFESHICNWTDVSVGQFTWQRGRNGTTTTNTGPSVDHTTGTNLGWYMAVEASDGDSNSYAALESPAMKQSSADCVLEFYYHMYGEGIGELKVLLQEGVRRTPLWWKSGDHGDEWHQAEVLIGRTHQFFTVIFEATRTFSELGDIAIDDVAFTNCSLPEPQDSCPPGTFTCFNHACVEMNRVCDFSDDCGDGSDEAVCDGLGYKQRCSFEQGMCSWESHDRSAGWTLERGERVFPDHGPPRDHTRNIAAGHYIVPATQTQTAEIMSSTLLPSSGCTVSFYYFSHGNISTAGLTMRLRTLHTGDHDVLLWSFKATQKYDWTKTEVTFSSSVNSKIVFQSTDKTSEEYIAVDDVSFSPSCAFDPDNRELPVSTPTPTVMPITSPSTPRSTEHPCREDEFRCWRSDQKCIAAHARCDYRIDCSLGEDEETCGPCTFEYGLCSWSDTSQHDNKWQRIKASENTLPPDDHTSGTGHYMHVNVSKVRSESDVLFESPSLPPTSPYCQILFYFYLTEDDGAGGLSVFLHNEEKEKTQLWTRTKSTAGHWSLEHLAIGKQEQPYRITFSSSSNPLKNSVALDDISFLNCETSFDPPALATAGCSFEADLCGWVQGSSEDFPWLRNNKPSESFNTGPAGDHTSSTGYYMYIKSSSPVRKGTVAQLKSTVLPPAGQNGYCLSIYYHMFGATVGSLKISLLSVHSRKTSLFWQRNGTQGNEWQVAQLHVTLQEVHQVLIEASVGGEAGDIAVDDLIFAEGACIPTEGFCDFELGSCAWTQMPDDNLDWVRGSGNIPVVSSQPSFDHTTYTDSGHYYYMGSSSSHVPGHAAKMRSPLLTSGTMQCFHLWYYISGQDPGVLNVYQERSDGTNSLLLSQDGEHGELWRFAQAPITHTGPEYRIVVEGIEGRSEQGVMAVDDVRVSGYPCIDPGHCDFEVNMCSWSNLLDEDDTDWLRNHGNAKAPSTGPSVDHTTNSAIGYYLYVDVSVGQHGDRALLLSEIFTPDNKEQCFRFWYHMNGLNVGTLSLYVNNRTLYTSGEKLGCLMWTDSEDHRDVWWQATVKIDQKEPFWFVFEYNKGQGSSGDVAIDDVQITHGPCNPEPPTNVSHRDAVGIGVGVTLLVVAVVCTALYVLWRKRFNIISYRDSDTDMLETNAVYDLNYGELEETES